MGYLLILFSATASLQFVHSADFLYLKTRNLTEDNEGPGKPLFLTPYIESERIKEGQEAAKVNGFLDDVNSYSGYLTVNKNFNSNTFFWYIESETDPENAPVLVWLQGGPGITSLYGLFMENGPFSMADEKLVKREHRWNKKVNLIYIDNPVGTGYSFTDSDKGYVENERDIGRDLYATIVQFFKLFPHLQKNKFFISGESYAGKYVPAFGYEIHKKNSDPKTNFKINLQGLLIGGGWIDPVNMLLYSDYLYQLGFLDQNERQLIKQYENRSREYIVKNEYKGAFIEINGMHRQILRYTGFGNNFFYNYLNVKKEFWPISADKFVTSDKFRRSVHVGDKQWHFSNKEVYRYIGVDISKSVIDLVAELLKDYKVTFYNGQLDVVCAYPLTENALSKMQWDGKEEFSKAKKHPWFVDKEVVGYYKETKNLTFVLVRNAGHMVPADQPKWAEDMVHKLIFDGHF